MGVCFHRQIQFTKYKDLKGNPTRCKFASDASFRRCIVEWELRFQISRSVKLSKVISSYYNRAINRAIARMKSVNCVTTNEVYIVVAGLHEKSQLSEGALVLIRYSMSVGPLNALGHPRRTILFFACRCDLCITALQPGEHASRSSASPLYSRLVFHLSHTESHASHICPLFRPSITLRNYIMSTVVIGRIRSSVLEFRARSVEKDDQRLRHHVEFARITLSLSPMYRWHPHIYILTLTRGRPLCRCGPPFLRWPSMTKRSKLR